MASLLDLMVTVRAEGVRETEAELKGLESQAASTEKAMNSRLASGAKYAGAALTALAAGGIAVAGKALLEYNSNLEQNRIAFTTMLGSAQKADKFLRRLQKFAAATPFEFPELTDAAKRMLAYGFAAKDVVPTLRAVGDASAALGGGKDTIDGITTALGQMAAKGKVSAEEMMQLAERGVPAWKILADGLGVTTAQAQKMVSKGIVPADKAIRILTRGMERLYGGQMQKQSQTLAGAWSTIKDTVQAAASQAFMPMFKLLERGTVSLANFLSHNPAIARMAAVFGLLAAAVAAVGGPILLLVGFLTPAIASVGGLSAAVAGLMAAFTTILPVIAVVGGVLGALALGAVLLYKNWSRVGPLFRRAAASLAAFGRYIRFVWQEGDTLNDWLAHLPPAMRPLARAIGGAIATLHGFVSALFGSRRALRDLPGPLGGVVGILRGAFAAGMRLATSLVRIFVRWFERNLPLMRKTARTVLGWIAGFFRAQFSIIRTVVTNTTRAVLFVWRATHNQIRNIARSAWRVIATIFRASLKILLQLVRLGMQLITGDWRGAWKTIQRILRIAWNAIKVIIRAAARIVVNLLRAAWNVLVRLTRAAWDAIRKWITSRFRDAVEGVKHAATEMRRWLQDSWHNILRSARDLFAKIGGAIWHPIRDAYNQVATWVNRLIRLINSVLDKVGLPTIKWRMPTFAEGGVREHGSSRRGAEPARPGVAFAEGGTVRRRGYATSATYLVGEDLAPGEREYILTESRKGNRRKRNARLWAEYGKRNGLLRPFGERPGTYVTAPVPAYAAGGLFSDEQLKSLWRWARSKNGSPYVWGGGSIPPGVDCSGWAALVMKRALGDPNPSGRLGSTANMPWQGWERGPGQLSFGFINGGPGGGHVAMTIAGKGWAANTETGGPHGNTWTNTMSNSGPAWGASNPYFRGNIWHLGSDVSLADIGGGGFNPLAALFERLWARLVQPVVDRFLKPLTSSPNVLLNFAGAAAKRIPDGIKRWIESKIGSGGGDYGSDAIGGDPAKNRALGRRMVSAAGWASQWGAFDRLAMRESGWNRFARNPSSGAYGIPQALPESKLPPAGRSTGGSHAGPQIGWMIDYIRQRYGDPNSAWAHEQSAGWYARGGYIRRNHIAEVHKNELYLPLDHPYVEKTARAALGTRELKEEISRLRESVERTSRELRHELGRKGINAMIANVEEMVEAVYASQDSPRGRKIQERNRRAEYERYLNKYARG